MFFMLRRKREMMQKKKKNVFTVVLGAMGNQHSTNTHVHSTVLCAIFLSNKTLTMKHGQFSFSDSSVVHSTAHSQSR